MKTVNEIGQDMSELYDALKNGQIKREDAQELANIAGKNLKAAQLALANEIFVKQTKSRAQLPFFSSK